MEEAAAALAAVPGSTLLAGGTDLMVEVNFGHLRPTRVVTLRRTAGLDELDGGRIGAGVTWSRLERCRWPGLAEAARTVGSPQIRHAGTLGGNLGTASPAGDGLPFLAAVDARVELVSQTGKRVLQWDEFLVGPKRTARRDDEVISAALLPERLPARQAFAKIGVRNAMVISVASVCVVRDEDGTTRVALGSVGPVPIRARRAEEMISAETRPSEAALAEFARLVSTEVRPITDHRSTESYRRYASGVIARRALERCLS